MLCSIVLKFELRKQCKYINAYYIGFEKSEDGYKPSLFSHRNFVAIALKQTQITSDAQGNWPGVGKSGRLSLEASSGVAILQSSLCVCGRGWGDDNSNNQWIPLTHVESVSMSWRLHGGIGMIQHFTRNTLPETHLPLVPHTCPRESGQHWFR